MSDEIQISVFLESNTNLIFFDDGKNMFHIVKEGELNGLDVLIMYENEVCPVKLAFGDLSDEDDDQKGIQIAVLSNEKLVPLEKILDCASSISYIVLDQIKKEIIDGKANNSETSAA